MSIGNKYLGLVASELIQKDEVTKFINLKIYPLSLLVQLEATYILFSISIFNKLRANLTLTVL